MAAGIALVPTIGLGAVVLGLGPPSPGDRFLTALLVSGSINAVATPLIVWALKHGDLSLVAPLTSLTPLFMLGTGVLVLGEVPSALGGLGVAVIVAGAYLLNLTDRRLGLLAPFRALVRDAGARAMLLVAFLYSVSSTYDKVGTQASSPLFWAASVQAVVASVLVPLAAWRWRIRRRRSGVSGSSDPSRQTGPRSPRDPTTTATAEDGAAATLAGVEVGPVTATLLAGAILAIGLAAQMTALTLTLAAYVISVKRISTLFGVLLGHALFHEADLRQRLLGAAVMLAGFVLLTLG